MSDSGQALQQGLGAGFSVCSDTPRAPAGRAVTAMACPACEVQELNDSAAPADAGIDPQRLREALADADLRVLLMVLHQLTGDRRWISDPLLPRRDVRLIADESAGFDEATQRLIRDAAFELLSRGVPSPAIARPDDAKILEMMSACLGEAVDPAYAPMVREDMGVADGDAHWSAEPDPDLLEQSRVLIIGAGVSGLGLAMQLQRLGIAYQIIERNEDVGGTWLENRYPGAGVDTPNLFYSWSSQRNPHWTRYFSLRDEILGYLQGTANRVGLREHIRFGTEMRRADWDEQRLLWRVQLAPKGAAPDAVCETLEVRYLVSAIGHISEPNQTRIDGMQDFQGPMFHSARWPERLELAGKRVAILGTGATAMQLAPAIVEQVAQLTIYQRTAQWARPTPELRREVSPAARWLFANVPFYAQWYRFTLFWRYGDGLLRFLRKDSQWPHPERSLNRVNDKHREQMTEHIRTVLASRPDLVDKCVPDYPPYGKRILLDNGWYDMLLRKDVELVTEPVSRFDADGAVTADGQHRAHDVVVLATGFSIAKLSARLDIRGLGGLTLAEAWADDNPRAYLGITVPDFPNLFILYGPNTNLGHGGSAIFHAECQVRYITRSIVQAIEHRVQALDVKRAVHDAWIAKVDEEHAQLIWTHPGMSTWYRNQHGRVVSTSPFRLVDYWRMTHEADLDNYRQLTVQEGADTG